MSAKPRIVPLLLLMALRLFFATQRAYVLAFARADFNAQSIGLISDGVRALDELPTEPLQHMPFRDFSGQAEEMLGTLDSIVRGLDQEGE